MAAKRGKAKSTTKTKKKAWYTILAPNLFNNTIVGETLSVNSTFLPGKTVDYNLMYLSGDARKQNILVKLVIDSVEDGKAVTSMIGYRIIPTALKRYIRKGMDKIEDSAYFKTADNKIVWIKPFILTYLNTTRSTRTDIRLRIRSLLAHYFSKTTFETMLKDLVSGTLQSKMRQNIREIYPVRTVEIRFMLHVSETLRINKNIITLSSLPKKAFQSARRPPQLKRVPPTSANTSASFINRDRVDVRRTKEKQQTYK